MKKYKYLILIQKYAPKTILALVTIITPLYLSHVANTIATYSAPLEYTYRDSGIVIDPTESTHPSINFETIGSFEFTQNEIFEFASISSISNNSNVTINKGAIKDIQYFFLNTTDSTGETLSCDVNTLNFYTLMTEVERSQKGCYFYPYSDSPPYSSTTLKMIYNHPKFQLDYFDVFVLITDKSNIHYVDFMRVFS